MNQSWIILGATSSMARAFARSVAAEGAAVFVAGRDMDDLKRTAADCAARGARHAEALPFDARDPSGFATLIDRLDQEDGALNAAVFVGSMPSQDEVDADPALIDGVITDNYTGPARFLHMLAPRIETRGQGVVVGVTSVAGDRGRLSNYVYGSSKAGFATYLSGLRNRLARSGAHVLTVKPGMVDTSMTWGLDGLIFPAKPEKVAADIAKAIRKKRNVIYTPSFWWLIMTIIRHVPEPIFKKMKF